MEEQELLLAEDGVGVRARRCEIVEPEERVHGTDVSSLPDLEAGYEGWYMCILSCLSTFKATKFRRTLEDKKPASIISDPKL